MSVELACTAHCHRRPSRGRSAIAVFIRVVFFIILLPPRRHKVWRRHRTRLLSCSHSHHLSQARFSKASFTEGRPTWTLSHRRRGLRPEPHGPITPTRRRGTVNLNSPCQSQPALTRLSPRVDIHTRPNISLDLRIHCMKHHCAIEKLSHTSRVLCVEGDFGSEVYLHSGIEIHRSSSIVSSFSIFSSESVTTPLLLDFSPFGSSTLVTN